MSVFHLEFLGGADHVTGSSCLLKCNGFTALIDAGLFQGDKNLRQQNWGHRNIPISQLNAIFITHAHIDHCGYLPRLYKNGCNAPIYTTQATAALMRIILKDAAYLEQELAEFANRTSYSHHKPALPLFTEKDVDKVLEFIRPVCRNSRHWINQGLSFEFHNAGHILGASLIQFHWRNNYHYKSLTFSGDLSTKKDSILKPASSLITSDIMVLESTYGAKLHPIENIEKELAVLIEKIITQKGVLLIPAFSVGRAQEILYMLHELEKKQLIQAIPVYLDSPMASQAMDICLKIPEDLNPFIQKPSFNIKNPLTPRYFTEIKSPEKSKELCEISGPFIVIAASGMITGGRIVHHLKARIANSKNIVLFTGYQAEGTKGRYLQDVSKIPENSTIRFHHEEFPIRAEIKTLESFSAHADYNEMIHWLRNLPSLPKEIILNHGSASSQKAFRDRLLNNFSGIKIHCSAESKKFIF